MSVDKRHNGNEAKRLGLTWREGQVSLNRRRRGIIRFEQLGKRERSCRVIRTKLNLPVPMIRLRFYPRYSVGKAERCREADVLHWKEISIPVTRASFSSFSSEESLLLDSICTRSPDCYNRKLQQPCKQLETNSKLIATRPAA